MSERPLIKTIELPDNWSVDYAEPPAQIALPDVRAAAQAALRAPLAALPLEELVDSGGHACIVVDALTPDAVEVVRAVADVLFDAGVGRENVTVLLAAGAAPSESLALRQVVHDPDDQREVNDLGVYEGVALRLNHHAVEVDLLVGISAFAIDRSTPDQGSAHTVAHGIAASATRRDLDAANFLDAHFGLNLSVDSLSLTAITREIARRAGLVFVVDRLVDSAGRSLAIKAGTPVAVHNELALVAHDLRSIPLNGDYDVLIAEAPIRDLYQAGRAATQIGLTPDSALQRGGIMILPIDAPQAESSAEADAFYDALGAGNNSEDVIKSLSGRTLSPGVSDAYLLAHVMQRNRVVTIVPSASDMASALTAKHFVHVRSIGEAADFAEIALGRRPRALVIPRADNAVPVSSGGANNDDDVVDALLKDLDL
jgi:nickel-dependent lactate racemase